MSINSINYKKCHILMANSIATIDDAGADPCIKCGCPKKHGFDVNPMIEIDGGVSSGFYGVYIQKKFPVFQVFSQDVVDFLGAGDWMWGKDSYKIKGRNFYRPIPKHIIDFVGHPILKPSGWKCSLCGHRSFSYYEKKSSIHQYVALNEVEKSGNFFFVGNKISYYLAMNGVGESLVKKHKVFKGSDYNHLGVVNDGVLSDDVPLPFR